MGRVMLAADRGHCDKPRFLATRRARAGESVARAHHGPVGFTGDSRCRQNVGSADRFAGEPARAASNQDIPGCDQLPERTQRSVSVRSRGGGPAAYRGDRGESYGARCGVDPAARSGSAPARRGTRQMGAATAGALICKRSLEVRGTRPRSPRCPPRSALRSCLPRARSCRDSGRWFATGSPR